MAAILSRPQCVNLLWPNHAIYRLRSWSTQIKVMASCMMTPSHYLKQCGLIIKLINKVPWHLYQWIIIKDLKIPISKMRLKLVLWDNFTSSPEIIHFILFSSDNSFVLCHGCKLIFIVTIFNPSDYCLLKENKVLPPMCLLWPHYRGAMFKELKPCCKRSQSHGRLWPLFKLKFGNCWLTSKCCGSSCKKIDSGFQFQFQSLQFQFHFQFQNWNWNWASIPIPELNWPQPCHLPTQCTTHTIMLQ